jgi:hypothetical protein
MKKQIILSENKVLEHNEKAFKDTLQLFSNLNEDNIDKEISRAENDPKIKDILPNMHFDKGRTIWLELKVEDSYLSGLILSWMYSNSNYDEKSGLQALGCTLQSIMFSKPSGYSDQEKEAIRMLYDAAFGNDR